MPMLDDVNERLSYGPRSGGRNKLALHSAILGPLPTNAANDLATLQIDNRNHFHAASLAAGYVIVDGFREAVMIRGPVSRRRRAPWVVAQFPCLR